MEGSTVFDSEFERGLFDLRRAKLTEIEKLGQAVYPNQFPASHTVNEVRATWGETTGEELEANRVTVAVAGRIMAIRAQGKAGFATLQQGGERLQIYVRLDAVGEQGFALYKLLDLGDHIGVSGYLFRTRTGELTVHVERLTFLAKAMLALPEKYHGLADVELRYRLRYVDLFTNLDSREVFVKRAKVLRALRQFFDERGYLEVETPMMQPVAGGATARPFRTHHNALDMDLFLRIAPELYLKRLLVGGFERVFEINRNFRNEGISVRHNPEFTMMEFYCAYWNHGDVMDFTETLIRQAAIRACGTAHVSYQGRTVDLESSFARLSVRDALVTHAGLNPDEACDPAVLRARLRSAGEPAPAHWTLAELQFGLFEAVVEEQLWNPTYITDYPVEVSPLARASDADPSITERFELFATGREIANGFSELNDPEDQAARFAAQVANKDAGDEEAMYFDADYIRALEVGMPPAGGCGIGIDRLVMLLTDAPSIRDVILFPALRRVAE